MPGTSDHCGPDGKGHSNKIVYAEIVRPERLVYKHFECALEFEATVNFAGQDGKTHLTMRMMFATDKDRGRNMRLHNPAEALHRLALEVSRIAGGRRNLSPLERAITRVFAAPQAAAYNTLTDP